MTLARVRERVAPKAPGEGWRMQWRDKAAAKARRLRRRQTDAEALLWAHLRNRALAG
jgi:very-short-patch-repair endonuclease